MYISDVKNILNKNGCLKIELNNEKIINNIKKYSLVAICRKYKSIISIEENIEVKDNNILEIDIYKNTKKLNSNEKTVFDFGLALKENNEIFKFKMNEDFELKGKSKFITPVIDMQDNVYGFIYYSIKNEISLKLTDTPKESINKCKSKTYTMKNHKGAIIEINETQFNLKNIKLKKDNLNLIFDESVGIDNSYSIKLTMKSRFNHKIYTLNIKKKDILRNKIVIDLKEFREKYTNEKDRWDIFIECTKENLIYHGKVGFYNKEFNNKYSKHLKPITTNGVNMITPFITMKNEIALLVDTYGKYVNEKFKNRVEITDINFKNRKLLIKGSLEFVEITDFKLDKGRLELRNKTKDKLNYELNIKSKYIGKNKVDYEIEVDLFEYKYEQFYWDIYLEPVVNDEKVKIRLKNPNNKVKSKINNKIMKFNFDLNDNYIVYPYITVNNCLSITYRQKGKYESKIYKIKEKIAQYVYTLLKAYFDKKEIWLIYEKFSETAQDNSFYFFKYCYENYPNRNIYYIITKDSKDYSNVEKYKDKVIHFMSIKHLIYMCAAKLLIASESKGHSYAWRVQTGYVKEKLNEKKMVFLQHGVTALKRVDGVFKKTASNGVDLFVATSNYEKNIIEEYFNYKPEEIIITGFTRWDVLKDKSKDLKNKEIFFMPTWRNWLDEVPEAEFEKSSYFINYMEILNSKELHKILEENEITINYFVHPKFKYYIDKFSTNSKNIKIVQPGEIQVNELLMRASLLITDYSSVAWEMYYQNKPTLFYHFDINDYNKYQGSYLDMENELFGDKAMNPTELIQYIKNYVNTDFKHPEKFVKMRKKYFSYVDNKNCERTYKEIYKRRKKLYKVLSKRQQILKDLRKNKLVKKVWYKVKNNPVIGQKVFEYKNKIFKKFKIEYKKDKKVA